MEVMVEAKDAIVIVDGFTRTSSSNTISDLVPGVTLTLTKANPDVKQTLTVGRDNSALKANLTAFVTAYNAINTQLKSATAYNSTTNTASALTGDAMVRGLQQQLRGQLSPNVNELKALGITLATDGTLTLDSTKLDAAIAKDPESVANMFGADGKVGKSMTDMLKSNLDATTGTITQRTNTLNKQIRIWKSAWTIWMRAWNRCPPATPSSSPRWSHLVSQMQTTSDYLTQQLAKKTSS